MDNVDPNLFWRSRQPEDEPEPVNKPLPVSDSVPFDPSRPHAAILRRAAQAGSSTPLQESQPATSAQGSQSPHATVLSRLNEEHQRKGRESHDRMMLHSTMEKEWEYLMGMRETHDRWLLHQACLKELNESLTSIRESEQEPVLEFESYTPGDASQALPEYFADVANHSDFPEYLTEYSPDDFAQFRLYKVKGVDAGFAIKKDGDLICVHNNSKNLRGLVRPMLAKAIAEGGTHLDHFDGKLSDLYAKQFPKISRFDVWDDKYAPKKWKYQPVEWAGSVHTKPGPHNDGADFELLRRNYAAGKPSIVYREIEK